jgi:hypothetical protein
MTSTDERQAQLDKLWRRAHGEPVLAPDGTPLQEEAAIPIEGSSYGSISPAMKPDDLSPSQARGVLDALVSLYGRHLDFTEE